jgi:hypothetical protein
MKDHGPPARIIRLRSGDFKRITIAFFSVLIVYFLFLSVLPGYEKVLKFVCSANDNAIFACQNAVCAYDSQDCDGIYGNDALCDNCGSSGQVGKYAIGGSGDSTGDVTGAPSTCCGDDTGEYNRSRVSSTDAPAAFSSSTSDDACCSVATKCVLSGVCTSTGGTSGTIPNKAYCNAGTWIGGDQATSAACDAIVGSARHLIGGEASVSPDLCCGDDSSEYRITETAGTDAPSPYDASIGTTCCDTSSDCTEAGTDTCTATGSAVGTIPNKAYCGASNTWYGGDAADGGTACASIMGGTGYYNIGGETAATTCCGDDGSTENRITEISGTDAPSPYNTNSGTACCIQSTDCVESAGDVCTAASTVAGSGYNKAYCGASNTWYGGDYSGTTCAAIAGTGRYDIGGEASIGADLCCGDDANEYNLSKMIDEATLGSADATDDNACCAASTDCVYNSVCSDTGTHDTDVDGNGDTDYCLNGMWYDCLTDSDCTSPRICSAGSRDCINKDGGITIRNLGTTGVEESNQEYTSSRNVMLVLNFTENAEKCRYSNAESILTSPTDEYGGWTPWETCVQQRIWLLADTGPDLKVVYYQLNFTNRNATFNDSIFYNFTGAGLDITPPSDPIVYHNNYTNDNEHITIYWYNATDYESNILNLPLQFEVTIFTDTQVLASAFTSSFQYTFDLEEEDRQPDETRIWANVTAINSAGLRSNGTSGILRIDLQAPTISSLAGQFLNISNDRYTSFSGIDEDSWIYASIVNFTWAGSDVGSYVVAYSYSLSTSPIEPDDIPEGNINSFETELYKRYTGLRSGKYYFMVKAKDKAGNWGTPSSINFSIDNTPPSQPKVATSTWGDTNLTFTWLPSTDAESDVIYYLVNLTHRNGTPIQTNNMTTSTYFTYPGLSSYDFNATICAVNGAGIPRWSNQDNIITDFEPPVVRATPNKTVASATPIVRAWTDEPAVCHYNWSEATTLFKYSNTTYHETKLPALSDGDHTLIITCSDMYNNEAEGYELNFTVLDGATPSSLVAEPLDGNVYKEIMKTIVFKATNASISPAEIGGIRQDRFTILLDGESFEYALFDRGDGYYNVTFIPEALGAQMISIEVDSHNKVEVHFEVERLGLTLIHENSYITAKPDKENHIAYFTSDRRIGLATETDDSMDFESVDGMLNASNVDINSRLYIFNTRAKATMSEREGRLREDRFISLVNPSFGYPISDKYYIYYILKYDRYDIDAEFDTLHTGKHNIRLMRTLDDDGKVAITLSKSDQMNSRVVLTG